MNRTEALHHLTESRVGHLATVRPDGSPHVVPVTFAITNNRIVTMVDHKPKSTTQLQRLANVDAHGVAEFVIDHYSDQWHELWWVRVNGPAEVQHEGDEWEHAARVLADKYPQYRQRTPSGPAISILVDELSYWSSTP